MNSTLFQPFIRVLAVAGVFLIVSSPVPAGSMPGVSLLFDELFNDRFEGVSETCSVSGWSLATGLTDANVGQQSLDHRRYAGPCGLRVPLDGTARFLTDASPLTEMSFLVRFYAFFDDISTSQPLLVHTAGDFDDDPVQIWYNEPSSGDLTLRLLDEYGVLHDLTFPDIPAGWHSIEYEWSAEDMAQISFALNSDDPADALIAELDSRDLTISDASLGNLNGANGGSLDFDAYDSRRITRPGRLLVADADDNLQIDIADIIAVADELDGLGFAPGQPDCNEDGSIDPADADCIVDILDNQ